MAHTPRRRWTRNKRKRKSSQSDTVTVKNAKDVEPKTDIENGHGERVRDSDGEEDRGVIDTDGPGERVRDGRREGAQRREPSKVSLRREGRDPRARKRERERGSARRE